MTAIQCQVFSEVWLSRRMFGVGALEFGRYPSIKYT